MKWPKSLSIGGLTYKIHYITAGKNPAYLAKDEAGAIVQNTLNIYIDKTLPDELKIVILLHEILHGIGDSISPNKGPFLKEDFTNITSQLLLQALKSTGLLKIS